MLRLFLVAFLAGCDLYGSVLKRSVRFNFPAACYRACWRDRPVQGASQRYDELSESSTRERERYSQFILQSRVKFDWGSCHVSHACHVAGRGPRVSSLECEPSNNWVSSAGDSSALGWWAGYKATTSQRMLTGQEQPDNETCQDHLDFVAHC